MIDTSIRENDPQMKPENWGIRIRDWFTFQ